MTLAEMLGQPGASAWLKPGSDPDPGGEWRQWNVGGDMAWMLIPGYATGPDAAGGAQRQPSGIVPSGDAADYFMQRPAPPVSRRRVDGLAEKVNALIREGKLYSDGGDVGWGNNPRLGWNNYYPSPAEARLVGRLFRKDFFGWSDGESSPDPYRWPNEQWAQGTDAGPWWYSEGDD